MQEKNTKKQSSKKTIDIDNNLRCFSVCSSNVINCDSQMWKNGQLLMPITKTMHDGK